MKNYIYSDLALESKCVPQVGRSRAEEYTEEEKDGIKICRLNISNEALAEKYGRACGSYVTFLCGKIQLLSDNEYEKISKNIGNELKQMISHVVKKNIDSSFSVLVVGLGNAEMTPDAIGPLTVSHLTVTRHITDICPEIFHDLGECNVSAISPGVLAQTGIETLELIRGAVAQTSPDAIIAVDALAARSCERLASTVQISDTGISPGSGIGNLRKAINRENLGVPVIALGVPTVVDSATLVYDALERAGIDSVDNRLREVLDNGKGFFVSPKECDIIVDATAQLLAHSIDKALTIA